MGYEFLGPIGMGLQLRRQGWQLDERTFHARKFMGRLAAGETVLIIRHGGHGDLMMLAPVIRELRRRNPHGRIWLGTGKQYEFTAKRLHGVDDVFWTPLPLTLVEKATYHLLLEGSVEGPAGSQIHATDAFARRATIGEPDTGWQVALRAIPRRHRREAVAMLGELPRPRIGIQLGASTLLRTWPRDHAIVLAATLASLGCGVVLLGDEKQRTFELPAKMPIDVPGAILNLAGRLTFGVTCAIIDNMDLLVAPDSGLLHVAATLPQPTRAIGIYGPFPADIRTAYYSRVRTLDEASAVCQRAPCQLHGWAICPMTHRTSACLEAIAPETVLAAILEELPALHRSWDGTIPWALRWEEEGEVVAQ